MINTLTPIGNLAEVVEPRKTLTPTVPGQRTSFKPAEVPATKRLAIGRAVWATDTATSWSGRTGRDEDFCGLLALQRFQARTRDVAYNPKDWGDVT